MKTKTCFCIFYHPATPEERKRVVKALEYARKVGDSNGTAIALAQLGRCPARDEDGGEPPVEDADIAAERAIEARAEREQGYDYD